MTSPKVQKCFRIIRMNLNQSGPDCPGIAWRAASLPESTESSFTSHKKSFVCLQPLILSLIPAPEKVCTLLLSWALLTSNSTSWISPKPVPCSSQEVAVTSQDAGTKQGRRPAVGLSLTRMLWVARPVPGQVLGGIWGHGRVGLHRARGLWCSHTWNPGVAGR